MLEEEVDAKREEFETLHVQLNLIVDSVVRINLSK